jgi:hypothetical protein
MTNTNWLVLGLALYASPIHSYKAYNAIVKLSCDETLNTPDRAWLHFSAKNTTGAFI